MSAITTRFEATLGHATELHTELELGRSSGNCGTLAPRWWAVDVGVRAKVLDTSAGAVPRPGTAEFHKPGCASRAPLHVRLRLGLLDGHSGSGRDYLIDATSTRAYVFASSVTAYLVGPESLVRYDKAGGASYSAAQDLFTQLAVGLWPCDTVLQRIGLPGSVGRPCSCSIRARVPAEAEGFAVAIPEGARTLTIYDSAGSDEPWTWQLGDPATEQRGRIPVVDGASAEVLIPAATHVAPVRRVPAERDVVLVFGVDL